MITAKHIPWEPIGTLPDDRKDGRRLLLWEIDMPVIGRCDNDRRGWEDPESMHLLENITHWSDITRPCDGKTMGDNPPVLAIREMLTTRSNLEAARLTKSRKFIAGGTLLRIPSPGGKPVGGSEG